MNDLPKKPIGELFTIEKGTLQSSKNESGNYDFITASEDWKKHESYSHDCEALVFAMAASGSLGRTHYVRGKFIASDLCFILKPTPKHSSLDLRLYHKIFNALKKSIVSATATGTSKLSINRTNFEQFEIPYVETSKQGDFGKRLSEVELLQQKLTAESDTQASLLVQLRQAILQLAVQGRLVPQNEKEGTSASVLNAKLKLPKDYFRPTKRVKETPIILPDNLFAALPSSWSYASVQELYDQNAILDFADGNHGELYPRKNEFGDAGVRFVTAAQIDHGRIQWEKVPRLNDQKAGELTKGWSRGGDVLLTHNASVGDVAFVEPDAGTFLLGTSVTFYRLHPDGLDSRFVYYVFQSPIWQCQLAAVMAQTTRNQVSIQKQAFFKIPVPPLAEQKRIVARVEELLRWCDTLEAQLHQTRTLGAHLLDSTLHHLLAA